MSRAPLLTLLIVAAAAMSEPVAADGSSAVEGQGSSPAPAADETSSVTHAPAAEMSPERQRQVLHQAANAFDQAVSVALSDPAQARELYRQAAASYEALLAAGPHNAALEYNLGNTYFRLGELGRGIVHYRRAARLDPSDKKLQANLAYARRQVEPHVEPAGQNRLWRELLFWHYGTSPTQRFRVAALLAVVGWLLLIVRLRRPARPLLIGGVAAVLLGLAAGTSVVAQISEETRHPPAVIVGDQHILRLGRGEGYDPALRQPLGPGVELRILQQRGDWVEVRLPNNQTGWLPAAALEPVQ